MAFDSHRNLAISSVATPPAPATSGTSLTVKAGEGGRFTAPAPATIWPANAAPTPANAEIVRVTAVAGDVLTIVRAQEGSTARAVGVGDLVAATVTAKTLTDLETQAALKDAANVFTARQTIQSALPTLSLIDPTQAANQKRYDLVTSMTDFYVQFMSDAGVALTSPLCATQQGDLWVTRDIHEKNRNDALGHPVPVAFNPASYSCSPGTWTVLAGHVKQDAYALIGRTAVYTCAIEGSTTTGAPVRLEISNPVVGHAMSVRASAALNVNNTEIGQVFVIPADNRLFLQRPGVIAFPATITHLSLTIIMFLP